MARRTDPATSHAAAIRHTETKLSERRQQVLDLVTRFPDRTAGELGRVMHSEHPDLSIVVAASTPNKRLPELEKLGLVKRGDKRKCKDSGYECHVWRFASQPKAPEQAKLF